MRRSVKIWLVLVAAPIPLGLSVFALGLIGLAAFWGYYSPLWFLGEPFFLYSSDTGMYYPTWAGAAIAVVIYSIVYWMGVYAWSLLAKIQIRR
jgi:hypothetical protein